MCGGRDSDGPGSTGGRGSGFGGVGSSVGGGFGMSSVAGNTAAGVGGGGFGGGRGGKSSSGKGESSTPQGLRSIEDAMRGLNIAGPQLSRARDNAALTVMSYGLTAAGLATGFPGFTAAAKMATLARDYARSFASRTPMEKAAEALGMGSPQRDGDAGISSGLSGIPKARAKPAAKAPAKAAASGNTGSGQSGATVIMGADKTRTGAGAGGRTRGSVRGFGSGGLKL